MGYLVLGGPWITGRYGGYPRFVATKLLLAEDASITKTLNVGKGGQVRASVREGEYRWPVTCSSEAPFSVDETVMPL